MPSKKQVLATFMDAHNKHDYDGVQATMADDFVFAVGDMEMSGQAYLDTMKVVAKSFPDMAFAFDLSDEGEFSKIKVTGTHTGEPYALGDLPAIPTWRWLGKLPLLKVINFKNFGQLLLPFFILGKKWKSA